MFGPGFGVALPAMLPTNAWVMPWHSSSGTDVQLATQSPTVTVPPKVGEAERDGEGDAATVAVGIGVGVEGISVGSGVELHAAAAALIATKSTARTARRRVTRQR